MKKKILSIFLSILLIFSAIPFMNINSFATDDECSIYGHSFGDWETIQYVTCAQEGIDRRTCTVCGVYEEEITPINPYHNFVVIEDVPATCVSDGYQVMECDICFFTDTLEYSANGHRDSNNDGACDICEFFSGVCGDNLTWSYYGETGTLTISGTGEINDTPWTLYEDFIKEIVIEDGVTSIGVCAFDRLGALTTVTIPDSVTSIGNFAFSECEKLTEITLPNGLTTISSYLFCDCSSLTTVTIPDSVTSIETHAFKGCTVLTTVRIPDSVTSIGTSAFSECESLTEITLPNELTVIPTYLFSDCLSLTTVTIPDSVTSIEYGAFAWCEKLTEITLPDGLTTIDDYLFRGCSSLTNITIPDSVTSIGYMAFEKCKKLTEITLPDGLKTIGSRSFFSCSSLATVIIPDSVTQIEDRAFAYSSKITDVYYSGTEEQWNSITVGSDNTPLLDATIHYNYIVPNKFTGIKDNHFYKHDVMQKAYQLVEFDGDFYFIGDRHEIVKNKQVYLNEARISGLTYADGTPIAVGYYEFDENGKMIMREGIVGNNIYKNNTLLKAYQLVEVDGDFYYISDRHEFVKNKRVYLKEDRINGLTYAEGTPITAGYYDFDENGKMVILNGVVGNHIYKNNAMLKAYQLVEIDGDFYFIGDRHEIAKDRKIYLNEERINGLTFADGTPITTGYYNVDADGKLIIE